MGDQLELREAQPITAAPPESASAPVPERGDAPRGRWFKVLGPFTGLLILWLWLFYQGGALSEPPRGNNFGADVAIFLAASQVLQNGGNPYDHTVLIRTEHAMLTRQHVPTLKRVKLVRAGNPPLFFWALQPLLRLPFMTVARVWLGSMYLLSGVGFVATLVYFSWTRRLIPTLIFMSMPEVILGPGNLDGLMFAVVGVALALSRKYPLLAGILLSLTWMKPQVYIPAALLVAVFHKPSSRRVVIGLIGGTIALIGLTFAATGPESLSLWAHGLVSFSNTVGQQKELASLSGLYAASVPQPVGVALTALTVLAACAATVFMWQRFRGDPALPFMGIAWLWFLWFIATPYDHYPNEILLAVPVVALLGRNGYRATWVLPAAALYVMLLMVVLVGWTPLHASLLPLPLLALTIALFRVRQDPHYLAA